MPDDPENRSVHTGPESYGAVRAWLADVEGDAARTRLEADRYARQREQEAELLVAKARRLLVAAEERAAVIVAVAQTEAAEVRAGKVLDLRAAEEEQIDGAPTAIDRMLASAFSSAVSDAFPISLR